MFGNLEIGLRLLAAVLLCGLIGLEREVYRKPAGLRTHILVGLGAAIFMMISLLMVRLEEGGIAVDASRVVAGVVTGIGFLGAGTIIRSGEGVRGLTTAASIWAAAGVGLAAGGGYYFLATAGSLFTVAVLFLISRLEGGHEAPGPRGAAAARPRRKKKQGKKIAREDF